MIKLTRSSEPAPSPDAEGGDDAALTRRWIREMTAKDQGFSGGELLGVNLSPRTVIDLTAAHPSGLTQLLSGRKTRLSTMLRDKETFEQSMRTARSIRSRIFDLGQQRGIDAGYLASGMAYWRYTGKDGSSVPVSAPVLLSPLRLTIHPSHDEYEVQLAGPARLNPVLLRHVRQDLGIELDQVALEASAYRTSRMNPIPVLDALRAATEHLSDSQVVQQVFISTFVQLSDPSADPAVSHEHPLISDLARSSQNISEDEPQFSGPAPAVPDDLHPSEEFLVLDADASQHAVLDRAESGESFVVSSPPGTGQTQTAINLAARLAYLGRRVLVVAERRGAIQQVQSTFSELGLGSLVRRVDTDVTNEEVRSHAISTIASHERIRPQDRSELHRVLVRRRELLQENLRSLHDERPQWGCSAHEAMQALAELTSGKNPPQTRVRLPLSVLRQLRERTGTTAKLRRFANLGGLDQKLSANAWYGARMGSAEETTRSLSSAMTIHEQTPKLSAQMRQITQEAGMKLGRTLEEWAEQLDLLANIHTSLSSFKADIFDRDVDDLLAATSSRAWRKEHGVEMGAFTRSRLRRVAKELILPEVHIEDLNEALGNVRDQYVLWKKFALPGHLPTAAQDVSGTQALLEQVREACGHLAQAAKGASFSHEPGKIPIDELRYSAERLVSDRSALATLPERTQLEDHLVSLGLKPLIEDLTRRSVDEHGVGAELELSWWSSVLEDIFAGEENLRSFDAQALNTLESEYRSADQAHIASGAPRLLEAVAERWRRAAQARHAASASLRSLLLDGEVNLRNLAAEDSELVTNIHPIWLGSVHTLTSQLGAGFRADVVIVVEAHSLDLAHALGVVARAPQLIAFGDPMLPAPRPFSLPEQEISVGEGLGKDSAGSLYAAVARVRPTVALEHLYRCVDSALMARLGHEFYGEQLKVLPQGDALAAGLRRLRLEFIQEGFGPRTARSEEVESVQAEVDRCVELVFDHIRSTPERSLAVITASDRHAARVAEAVRVRMEHEAWAAPFFRSRTEPFLVLPLGRANGHVRDHIVFSLGFGRPSSGEKTSAFGILSRPGGREFFNLALSRARKAMHVLSCLRPSDIDRSKLGYGALDLYELLSEEGGSGGTRSWNEAAAREHQREAKASEQTPLLNDLSQRLRSRSLRVRDNVDGIVDIAAFEQGSSGRDRFPAAVLTDSSERYQGLGVRERVRLLPQRLERYGWVPLAAWSVEIFMDPEESADRVLAALGLTPAVSAVSQEPGEEGPAFEGQEHAGEDDGVSQE